MRRLLNSGAVWAYSLGVLEDIRGRYTVTGAPTIVDSPYGHALRFDGTNDYITLAPEEEYALRFDSGAQDFSVVAWVRTAVLGAHQTIIDKRDGNADGWLLWLRISDVPSFILDSRIVSGPTTITDALWHCVAVVVDRSGNALVYLDGVPGTGVAMAGDVMATTTAPRIGAYSFGATNKWNGDIYAVAVYDRILTAAEVLAFSVNRTFDY